MQKCEPSFGAIPSAADRKKKQEEQADAEERQEDILAQLLKKDALERLNKAELVDPSKVWSHACGGRFHATLLALLTV